VRQVFFHMGMPKNGSSALQVFLAQNHAALARKSVDYFRLGNFEQGISGEIASGNGIDLARATLDQRNRSYVPNLDQQLEQFIRLVQKSPHETGLVSSEFFAAASDQGLRQVVSALEAIGVQAKAIYFIRSQEQFLAAAYMQEVKRRGETGDADRFARKSYKPVMHLRVDSFYRRMVRIFGDRNVACLLFEDARKLENGLFHLFLKHMGFDAHGLEFKTGDVNTSLAPADLPIMRELNRYKPRMLFSDFVIENSINSGRTRSGTVHSIFKPETVEEIRAFFAEENRNLARTLFNRDTLFPSHQNSPLPQHDLNTTSVADVVNFFGGLMVRYDKRIAQLEQTVKELKQQSKS
jgi:hypothetical protein